MKKVVQGSIYRGKQITWLIDGTTTPLPLTGATITGRMEQVGVSGSARAITGSLVITDAANGVFTWTFSQADVASDGMWNVQFIATFSGSPEVSMATKLEIERAI